MIMNGCVLLDFEKKKRIRVVSMKTCSLSHNFICNEGAVVSCSASIGLHPILKVSSNQVTTNQVKLFISVIGMMAMHSLI
ncbi:MAG: hypothetical protein AB2693_26600 [Candidatus Thiodiazotropha sp.]